MDDENKLITERKKKLEAIRKNYATYPNSFRKRDNSDDLIKNYNDIEKSELEKKAIKVTIAGRLLTIRGMGNSTFANLHDEFGKIQIYLQNLVKSATSKRTPSPKFKHPNGTITN